jgi:hypothetical protein
VLSDYSLPRQHLHQGVPPGLCLYNSYIRGCPHQILLCPPSTLPVGISLWQMEHLWTLLAVVSSEDATVDDVAGSQSSATCGGVAEIGTGASIRGVGCLTRWLVFVATECLVGAAEGLAIDIALELRDDSGQGRSRWRRRLHAAVATTGEHQEVEHEVLLLGALPLTYRR